MVEVLVLTLTNNNSSPFQIPIAISFLLRLLLLHLSPPSRRLLVEAIAVHTLIRLSPNIRISENVRRVKVEVEIMKSLRTTSDSALNRFQRKSNDTVDEISISSLQYISVH